MSKLLVLLPESKLVSKMDLREISCDDGRWIVLTEVHVKPSGFLRICLEHLHSLIFS